MPIACETCGQENRGEARYCSKCGSQLLTSPLDAWLGRLLLERYRILEPIGEGGMGRVYLAEQQMGTASRLVAVKVLHASHGADERVRKRFYRECEVVIHLTHPNTIQFFDFGQVDGRLFIVMEHVDGHSLTDALVAGPMDIERVDRLFSQIAGSLQEAHDKGVIHRDLKPDNILLTTRGGEQDFVKVCDFGIAKRHDEHVEITVEGTIVGTPQYMSPEQLSGSTDIDARSDVYSVGLLLFEMLTGRRPFSASTPLEWATQHTTVDPPSLDLFEETRDLEPQRKRAVMRALEKLPKDRQGSVRELASEFLGRDLGGLRGIASEPPPRDMVDAGAPTVQARTPGSRAEVLQPARAKSPASRAAAVLALAGIAGIGGAAYLMRERLGLVEVTPPVVMSDAGVEIPDAGHDAGEPEPSEWIRIVHQQRNITDAALALGPPDGRYATVRPRGTITLELLAGTRIESDGTTGPDVSIVLDEERSGPYRADVGEDRNQYTTVGSELVGSLDLDADQFEITRIRYIRIKNRSQRPVYLDAVGVYRSVRVAN